MEGYRRLRTSEPPGDHDVPDVELDTALALEAKNDSIGKMQPSNSQVASDALPSTVQLKAAATTRNADAIAATSADTAGIELTSTV